MDDTSPERVKRPPSLTAAIRAARLEEAERSQVVGDLRSGEMARLDLLREAIEPVLSQVPVEIDMFDIGLVAGERPRLFVDMISFIEMGRDKRTYRFLQDTRHGRVLVAENEGLGAMVEAITRYIARRLVEREKILASLGTDGTVAMPESAAPPPKSPPEPAGAPAQRPSAASYVGRALRLGVDGLGVVALAGLLWLGVQYAHGRIPAW